MVMPAINKKKEIKGTVENWIIIELVEINSFESFET